MSRFLGLDTHAGSGAQRSGAPAFIIRLSCEAAIFDLHAPREHLILSICLTPTRWDRKGLAAPLSARKRVGGRFWQEPRQNRDRTVNLLKLQGYAAPVLGSVGGASRDVCGPARACMRGGARVGMGQNHRTIELYNIVYEYQRDSGSKAVLSRFLPEPATAPSADNGGNLPFSNLIAVGYATPGAEAALQGLFAGALWEKFWGVGADRGARSRPIGRGSGALPGRAGMAEIRRSLAGHLSALDWSRWNDTAKALRYNGKSHRDVSLSGLVGGIVGAIDQAEGGGPPSRRAPSPSTLALPIFTNSDRPQDHEPVRFVVREKNPRTSTSHRGSGWRLSACALRRGWRGSRRNAQHVRVGESLRSGSPSISNGLMTLSGRTACVK